MLCFFFLHFFIISKIKTFTSTYLYAFVLEFRNYIILIDRISSSDTRFNFVNVLILNKIKMYCKKHKPYVFHVIKMYYPITYSHFIKKILSIYVLLLSIFKQLLTLILLFFFFKIIF